MSLRPIKAIYFFLLAALLLASCQTAPVLPSATAPVTPAGKTPLPGEYPSPVATQAATARSGLFDLTTARGKTILFWHPWSGDLAKAVDAAVADFNQKNTWGIQVKAQAWYSAGALYDAVAAGATAQPQVLPQVVAATGDQLAEWVVNGDRLADLSGYIQDAQAGMAEADVKSFQPVFWAEDQSGSRRWGVPALRSAQVIFYNQAWARELGFQSPPRTPEAFKEQACAAAKANNSLSNRNLAGTGGWLVDNDALTTLSWMSAFGAKAIPDGEGQPYTFESPAAEKAVAFLRGMFDQGCAWTGNDPMPYGYFSQRMALFYTASSSNIIAQSRSQEQYKSKDAWTVLPFPGEDGKPLAYTSGYSYALFKAKDPGEQLAAWLFVRWLEQPEVAARLAKALPSIPVSDGVTAQIGGDSSQFPWPALLALAESARPAPALSTWRDVRRLFEDAAWQIYRLPADQVSQVLPETLPQLDAAVKDMLQGTP